MGDEIPRQVPENIDQFMRKIGILSKPAFGNGDLKMYTIFHYLVMKKLPK